MAGALASGDAPKVRAEARAVAAPLSWRKRRRENVEDMEAATDGSVRQRGRMARPCGTRMNESDPAFRTRSGLPVEARVGLAPDGPREAARHTARAEAVGADLAVNRLGAVINVS